MFKFFVIITCYWCKVLYYVVIIDQIAVAYHIGFEQIGIHRFQIVDKLLIMIPPSVKSVVPPCLPPSLLRCRKTLLSTRVLLHQQNNYNKEKMEERK